MAYFLQNPTLGGRLSSHYYEWVNFLLTAVLGDWLPCISQDERTRLFERWFIGDHLPSGAAAIALLKYLAAIARRLDTVPRTSIMVEIESALELLARVARELLDRGLRILIKSAEVKIIQHIQKHLKKPVTDYMRVIIKYANIVLPLIVGKTR